MTQQINLFNPIFLKQKKHFSAVTMAQGLGLIVLGAVAVVVYARLQLSSMEREAVATSAQLSSTKAQLAKVSAEYAPKEASKALAAEIEQLQKQLASQREAFALVMSGGLGDTKGYSEYMRAFARQSVSGLWLTGFTMQGAGAEIELRGRTLQPELVPAYLGRLRNEAVMNGKSFATLAMALPEKAEAPQAERTASPAEGAKKPPYIEFTLRSSGIAVDEGKAGGANSR